MKELVKAFSEKRTFDVILFAGIWTSILGLCIDSTALGVCMTVFLVMLLFSSFMCIKASGFVTFFRASGFTPFYSISMLLWVGSLITLNMYSGNEEVRGIVANVAACVLVIGLAIIAMFPNKRVLPG